MTSWKWNDQSALPRPPVTSTFEREVREQPATLSALLEQGRPAAEAAAQAIRAHEPEFVMIAARGSSDNAARYGQYLFGVQNRLAVAPSAPSLITHYGVAPRLGRSAVLGISQSGQSPDVVAVLEEGRRQGAVTVAITNDPASPLARAARHVLPLGVGREEAVAATKTYTAQLAALAMLSAALRGEEERWRELHELPRLVSEALATSPAGPEAAAEFRAHQRLLIVGRGFDLATVFELALKIKETSYVSADPYSSADFLHGPAALLDEGLPVMVVASTHRAFDDLQAVVARAQQCGAPLIAITDSAELQRAARVSLPLPPGVPEWLTPVVSVVPGQLWAQALAFARGLTPDAPRGLSKVTLTR
jgi:glutamine---fructose-6-phosphate transaminase (isomerizing)